MKSFVHSNAMSFLNEIAEEFPKAVSLAAGRPTDKFLSRLSPEILTQAMTSYGCFSPGLQHSASWMPGILQYGRTAGMIQELVAQQLKLDEGINATPNRVIVTAGCQEALFLCFTALCCEREDVVLVCNPTYIGATGAAYAGGIAVEPISSTRTDLCGGILESIEVLRRSGRRVAALYLIPTFDNPTGNVLEDSARRSILEICIRFRIIVIEDNPYGMFRYDGESSTTMAELDSAGCVIYLSTFSKTIAPALRVGAATLPETLFGDKSASRNLFLDLVQRKSVLTVNTSQITQAIVAGLLLEENCSLKKMIEPAIAWYKYNRDQMLTQLDKSFSGIEYYVNWNQPRGGFFLAMDLPCQFDVHDVHDCASQFGVIVMPMRFFSFDDSQNSRIRLSFSWAHPEQVIKGVARLADYISNRMGSERGRG